MISTCISALLYVTLVYFSSKPGFIFGRSIAPIRDNVEDGDERDELLYGEILNLKAAFPTNMCCTPSDR